MKVEIDKKRFTEIQIQRTIKKVNPKEIQMKTRGTLTLNTTMMINMMRVDIEIFQKMMILSKKTS
jgi:hypothetical protein